MFPFLHLFKLNHFYIALHILQNLEEQEPSNISCLWVSLGADVPMCDMCRPGVSQRTASLTITAFPSMNTEFRFADY